MTKLKSLRIRFIHSLSGTMAVSERHFVEAARI